MSNHHYVSNAASAAKESAEKGQDVNEGWIAYVNEIPLQRFTKSDMDALRDIYLRSHRLVRSMMTSPVRS